MSLPTPGSGSRLRTATVLATTEDACTVFTGDERAVVGYAAPFPTPRTERVLPGHLVAIAAMGGGVDAVAWRWFDAVVLNSTGTGVELWEPAHGTVLATPRDASRRYRPGTRAYLSAGLPGADWWVSGPVVEDAAHADVERAELEQFLVDIGLWDTSS